MAAKARGHGLAGLTELIKLMCRRHGLRGELFHRYSTDKRDPLGHVAHLGGLAALVDVRRRVLERAIGFEHERAGRNAGAADKDRQAEV